MRSEADGDAKKRLVWRGAELHISEADEGQYYMHHQDPEDSDPRGNGKPRDEECAQEPVLLSAKAAAYTRWLANYKGVVLLIFAVLFVVGAYLAPKSLEQMTTDVPAAHGSYSEHANAVVRRHFPGKVAEHVVAILVSRWDGQAVLGPDGGEMLSRFTWHLEGCMKKLKDFRVVSHIDSWASYKKLKNIRDSFVSSDGSVSLITVTYNSSRIKETNLIAEVRSAMDAAPEQLRSELRALLTGLGPMNKATIDGVIQNLREMDSIAFPSALLFLGAALGSCRLMVLPVVAILSAVTLSFGIMLFPLTALCPVFILAGSMMMSLLIAVSVDYSLFMLSRLQAEARAACPGLRVELQAEVALANTLATAGHTVMVSGATLVLCFIGLVFCRENFMFSMGAGCAIAIVSAMIASLGLLPALILSCPWFFIGPELRIAEAVEESLNHSLEMSGFVDSYHSGNGAANGNGTENSNGDGRLAVMEAQRLQKTRWFRFSSFILQHKALILVLVLLTCAWPMARLPSIVLSRSPLFCVPYGNEAYRGFTQALENFGAGLLWPTKVVVLAPPGETVLTPQFFDRVAASIEEAKRKLPSDPGFSVQSLVYYNSTRVPVAVVQAAELACISQGRPKDVVSKGARRVFCAVNPDWCPNLDLLCLARHELVNEDQTAMVLQLTVDGDPWSPAGSRWLKEMRTAFPSDDSGGDRFYVVSNPSSQLDTVANIYQSGPRVFLLTVLAVTIVVAWSFKSVVVPLRLLPSIGLTLCWTYGMSVIVYQDGAFKWLGLSSLAPPPDIAPGILWIIPVLSFTILTGLCLDYDIFVLTRVEEFRLAGFSDHDSIILGVSSTGQTITVAGCIMLTAFSGLLLSKQLMLNQLSFFLIYCVILDTFVVRTILVPICMDVLGGVSNWWPRKMPPVTRSVALSAASASYS